MNEMRTYWIWNRWFGSAEWLEDIEHEYDAIEAAGLFDSGDFDTASRITPDPAGEDAAADDGRPVDVLRTAHTYRAVMARLYGTYSAKAQRAAAVFESLFAVRNVKFA